MIIQMCGLSGAGKTTLSINVKNKLLNKNIRCEIIDGDEYRKVINKDLDFSINGRKENIRRLGFIANKFSAHGIVCIICAINPFDDVRKELAALYDNVKLVYVDCNIAKLINRDTKGLYKKALLPADNKNKIDNLTGINSPFEVPDTPDLYINTTDDDEQTSISALYDFIVGLQSVSRKDY